MFPVVDERDPAKAHNFTDLKVVTGVEQLSQPFGIVGAHAFGERLEEVVVDSRNQQPRPQMKGNHNSPQVATWAYTRDSAY